MCSLVMIFLFGIDHYTITTVVCFGSCSTLRSLLDNNLIQDTTYAHAINKLDARQQQLDPESGMIGINHLA